MLNEVFLNVPCARCSEKQKSVKALTTGGAIRKATAQCPGIKIAGNGKVARTVCYPGHQEIGVEA